MLKKALITLIVALFALSTALPAIASTENESAAAVLYTAGAVNMRTGPSTKYPVAATLQFGDKVTLLRAEGKWSKVSCDGQEGYINSKYLADVALRTLAVYPVIKSTSVRSTASGKYKTLGKLKSNQSISVKRIFTISGKEWAEVFFEGKWGYVRASCLNMDAGSSPSVEKTTQALDASEYFVTNKDIYLGMYVDRKTDKDTLIVRVTQNADTNKIERELASILASVPEAKVQVIKSQMPAYANEAYVNDLVKKIGTNYAALSAEQQSQLELTTWGYSVVKDAITVGVYQLNTEKETLFKQWISDWAYIKLEDDQRLLPT